MTLNVKIMSVESLYMTSYTIPYHSQFTGYSQLKQNVKKFDLENEGQAGQNGTCTIRLEMFVSILVTFSYF